MRKAAAALLLLCTLACERTATNAPQAPQAPPKADPEQGNLLALKHGATVVSRTAENMLTSSAAHALDAEPETLWQSPPDGPSQSMVVALATRTRVTRLGVLTTPSASDTPQSVRFAASDDMSTWREVAALAPVSSSDPQFVNVAPFEASYLRIDLVEPKKQYAAVCSLYAYGTELAPPAPRELDGCWTVNGSRARFTQRGSGITGFVGKARVTGSVDGRVFRLTLRDEPVWFSALVTLDPRTRALSGLRFHENLTEWPGNAGGLFGTPAPCTSGR